MNTIVGNIRQVVVERVNPAEGAIQERGMADRCFRIYEGLQDKQKNLALRNPLTNVKRQMIRFLQLNPERQVSQEICIVLL